VEGAAKGIDQEFIEPGREYSLEFRMDFPGISPGAGFNSKPG
jgi:hypothetical protein